MRCLFNVICFLLGIAIAATICAGLWASIACHHTYCGGLLSPV